MAPKIKGKSKAPKAPTVPVSLTKGTSSNDIERLQQELDKVKKERDQFKLEKQQIQVQRDKIFSFWTVAEERVAKAKDQISALDSDMLQNQRRYLKELHVSKQTAEYFRIEFQKAASELKAGGSVSTEEEEEEEETIMSKPDQLRIEIRAMNLEGEHDRQLDELSNHLEEHVSVQDSMKEKEDVCVKHLTQLQQDLGNMTNNGIIKLEEQWSRDIKDKLGALLSSHKTDRTALGVLTRKRAQRKGFSVDELDAKFFEYGEPVQDAELQTEKKKMFVSLLVESLVSQTYRKAKGDTTLQPPEAIIRDTIFDMTWTEVEDFNFDTSRKLKNLHKLIFSDLCKNWGTSEQLLASMHVAPGRVAKCIASSFRSHVTHPEQHVTIRDLLLPLSKLITRKN